MQRCVPCHTNNTRVAVCSVPCRAVANDRFLFVFCTSLGTHCDAKRRSDVQAESSRGVRRSDHNVRTEFSVACRSSRPGRKGHSKLCSDSILQPSGCDGECKKAEEEEEEEEKEEKEGGRG